MTKDATGVGRTRWQQPDVSCQEKKQESASAKKVSVAFHRTVGQEVENARAFLSSKNIDKTLHTKQDVVNRMLEVLDNPNKHLAHNNLENLLSQKGSGIPKHVADKVYEAMKATPDVRVESRELNPELKSVTEEIRSVVDTLQAEFLRGQKESTPEYRQMLLNIQDVWDCLDAVDTEMEKDSINTLVVWKLSEKLDKAAEKIGVDQTLSALQALKREIISEKSPEIASWATGIVHQIPNSHRARFEKAIHDLITESSNNSPNSLDFLVAFERLESIIQEVMPEYQRGQEVEKSISSLRDDTKLVIEALQDGLVDELGDEAFDDFGFTGLFSEVLTGLESRKSAQEISESYDVLAQKIAEIPN